MAIDGGREPVASRAEVLSDRSIRGEKPLGVPGGLEALQAPLPLAGGLMRVLGTVVEVAVLAVLHTRFCQNSRQLGF